MGYSIITQKGNGVTNTFIVNFALGYLGDEGQYTTVTCRVGSEVDGGGNPVYRDVTWVSGNTATISGDPPGNDVDVKFTRTVSKTTLAVDWVDGAPITKGNLDTAIKQAIMISHEALDTNLGGISESVDLARSYAIRAETAANSITVTPQRSDDPYVSDGEPASQYPIAPYSAIGGRVIAGYSGKAVIMFNDTNSDESDINWADRNKSMNITEIRNFLNGSTGRLSLLYDMGTRANGVITLPTASYPVYLEASARNGIVPTLIANPTYGTLANPTILCPDTAVSLNKRDFSVFLLAAPVSSLDATTFISMLSSVSPSLVETVGMSLWGTQATSAAVGLHSPIGGSLTSPVQSSTLVPPSQPCVIGMTSSASNLIHYINGVSSSHSAITAGSIVGWLLGGTTISAGLGGNFELYAALIFDKALTAGQVAIVTRVLNNMIRRKSAAKARLVIRGDSRCTATSSTNLRNWTRELDTIIGDHFEIYNMSYAGQTADASATAYPTVIPGVLSGSIPNIFINLNGVNDINNGSSGATAWGRIRNEVLAARASGCLTIVATSYNMETFSGAQNTELAAMNTAIRAAAGTDFDVLCDLQSFAPFNQTNDNVLFPDGVHPSSVLAPALAGFVSAAVCSLVTL